MIGYVTVARFLLQQNTRSLIIIIIDRENICVCKKLYLKISYCCVNLCMTCGNLSFSVFTLMIVNYFSNQTITSFRTLVSFGHFSFPQSQFNALVGLYCNCLLILYCTRVRVIQLGRLGQVRQVGRSLGRLGQVRLGQVRQVGQIRVRQVRLGQVGTSICYIFHQRYSS